MRRFGIATVITALLLPAGAHRARAVQRLIDVRQIATDTLHDVALAAFENGRPVIYYNPVLLQQFGPELTTFFFAHEYGHIHYGHTGSALTAGEGDLGALRQRQELEADCYAARTLGAPTPRRWPQPPVLHPHGPVPLRRLAPQRRPARGQDSLVSAGPDDSSESSNTPHTPVARPTVPGAPLTLPHLSRCAETPAARAAGPPSRQPTGMSIATSARRLPLHPCPQEHPCAPCCSPPRSSSALLAGCSKPEPAAGAPSPDVVTLDSARTTADSTAAAVPDSATKMADSTMNAAKDSATATMPDSTSKP